MYIYIYVYNLHNTSFVCVNTHKHWQMDVHSPNIGESSVLIPIYVYVYIYIYT